MSVGKKKAKTLVLGLGNPILSDDGAGPAVARELEGRLDPREVTIAEASLGGLNLLDLLVGYSRAIIIDAIKTESGRPGQIFRLDPTALATTRYTASVHDVDLATALELGKKIGLTLPREIVIFAIEVDETGTFSEALTPAVAAAIHACAAMVMSELNKKAVA
jgi:hydrogenase maturation protease